MISWIEINPLVIRGNGNEWSKKAKAEAFSRNDHIPPDRLKIKVRNMQTLYKNACEVRDKLDDKKLQEKFPYFARWDAL